MFLGLRESTAMAINATTAALGSGCGTKRYWHLFLSSSLLTFGCGLVVIFIYRLVAWLCCRKKKIQVSFRGSGKHGTGDQAGGQRPSGGSFLNKTSDPEIGWMTEAKDWAGELISGQTTTGRILVRYRWFMKGREREREKGWAMAYRVTLYNNKIISCMFFPFSFSTNELNTYYFNH